jgi:hypothetical protein
MKEKELCRRRHIGRENIVHFSVLFFTVAMSSLLGVLTMAGPLDAQTLPGLPGTQPRTTLGAPQQLPAAPQPSTVPLPTGQQSAQPIKTHTGAPVRLTNSVPHAAQLAVTGKLQTHPDLVPAISGSESICTFYPSDGQTCENTCPQQITIIRLLGVQNQTAIPATGVISVTLLDNSNNQLHKWSVNNLAGNSTHYVAHISYPFQCTTTSNNRKLVIAGQGITEMPGDNNSYSFFMPPDATIGPYPY